ncbi:helix-turn-helix domain-containing protein [Candidatus Thioglobus sp.]|nr:helix-turn-helix domain-containing protein [Candidatus Thioglobus sp.]
MELLASRIKLARQSKNLSQKQLANRIGVSASAISQYEST